MTTERPKQTAPERMPVERPGGQPAQLAVDQGLLLLGGRGVALLDGRQDAGDVAHG